MSAFPSSIMPLPPHITPFSSESIGQEINQLAVSSLGSVAWQSANRAVFIPFSINQPMLVTQLFHNNGGTASGNLDVGLYDLAGTRLVSSGTTAQAGINTIQTFNITDTWIGPGSYFVAVAMNGTTGTMNRCTVTALQTQLLGIYQMAAAFPLPAVATFASSTGTAVPTVGLTRVVTV